MTGVQTCALPICKWLFTPAAVSGGQVYTYNFWYRSNTLAKAKADILLSNGSHVYMNLGDIATNTNWTNKSFVITMPSGAVTISIDNYIASNGYLETDDYSLIKN